jgi:hypothetical protein
MDRFGMVCGKQEDGGYLSTNRRVYSHYDPSFSAKGEVAHSIGDYRILENQFASRTLARQGKQKGL